MKLTIFSVLILLTITSVGQSRSELSNSKIYVCGTYENEKNNFIALETKTVLKDTTINNVVFSKLIAEHFIDYSKQRTSNIFFETFNANTYILLDENLKTIHKVNYSVAKPQTATIFGKNETVDLEFIDTRNSFPRDSLIPTDKTPRKYYLKSNSEVYLVIIPDLKTLAVSSNGAFYTKQLFGDNYNQISNSIKTNISISNRFEIQKGDEVQVFYRRKWYNDTTNVAEYEDKQFKNIKYIGDTTIEGNKALKFTIEGYNYLSGSKDEPEDFLTVVTDSGYYYGGSQFVPFKNYENELRIIGDTSGNNFFLQGVDFDSIGNSTYPKIVQVYSNSPYRYFILPFFPMPLIEFGNVQGIITYTKIRGKETGVKRERTYITDRTNIREIKCLSQNEVSFKIFFKEPCEVTITIGNDDNNKGELKTIASSGLQTFIVNTSKLTKGESYQVQISYKEKNSSGSFSNGFTENY
jgi:hypothetical protein